jgi:hypothetical protein
MNTACLFLALAALTAQPIATITGPTKAGLHDPVTIDTTDSIGQQFLLVIADGAGLRHVDLPRPALVVILPTTAGNMAIHLIALGSTDDAQAATATAKHSLTITNAPGPTPPPKPPTPPPGPEPPGPPADTWAALAQAVRDATGALKIDEPRRSTERKAIAQAFADQAPKATTYATGAELGKATAAQYREALGINAYLDWLPVFKRIEAELTGKQLTMDQYGQAWKAISQALSTQN